MIALLFVALNLVGLSLAAHRLFRDYAVARVWSPVVLVITLFFVEHGVGLGGLTIAGYVTTALSLVLIVRDRKTLLHHRKVEAAFFGSFAYAFAWRYYFPDLDGTHSEKLTDLGFILNYSRGDRLPPVDCWFPPYPFHMYYALQHYGAALLGRLVNVEPGVAYQYGFCTLVALTFTAGWHTASQLCRNRRALALVLVAFLIGGTGASVLLPVMKNSHYTWDSMRFIGGSATFQQVTTGFGKRLLKASGVPENDAQELPIETFGYLIHLGDYHPPLSGFLFLGAALACIVALEQRNSILLQGLLAATVPLALASDAWVAPLQGAMVLTWVGHRLWNRLAVDWLALIGGGLLATLALAPFLFHFFRNTSGARMAFRLVPWDLHTPPLLAAILLAPAFIVLAVSFFDEGHPLHRPLAVFWITCFVLSEVIYVDDLYSGKYTRFNTTLKWWGWTYAGALLTTASRNLHSPSRVCRFATIGALLLSCFYAWDLGKHFYSVPKPHAGQLHGAATITDDPAMERIIAYLRLHPPSAVLQRLDRGSYTLIPGAIMFAGHNAFLGWPDHERVWRGSMPEIGHRETEVRSFYDGTLPGAADWLRVNRVQHVLWLSADHAAHPGVWEKRNQELAEDFEWHDIGVWSRRN